jgi:hypothetical protein
MTTLDFTIDIHPSNWWSSNDRLHWGEKARRSHAVKEAGFAEAFTARIEHHLKPFLACEITAEICYLKPGRADPHNAQPVVKAIVDGMTDARVFVDDDSEHVKKLSFTRGPTTKKRGYYQVHIICEEIKP